MSPERTRTLELIGLDVSREVALLLDELFFRVEMLERENRRLNRIVAALEERQESEIQPVEIALTPLTPEIWREYFRSGAQDPRD